MAEPGAAETLGDWLERAAGVPGTGLRFVDARERERFVPWSEVRASAEAAACGLRRFGVRPGDRVALVYPTGEPFFAAFFGALAAGAVPVPLYPPVRLGRLEEYHARTAALVEACDAVAVLADPRVRRLLGEAMAAARPPLGCRTLADLPGGPGAWHVASPGDLALVQFSSGTTVEPKPVALTHAALCAQARILNSFWPDDGAVRHSGVSWLPLYHDMGLVGCVLTALERPAVLTLLPPEAFLARPALWLRAISRYRATISPAPNFAYGLCLERVRDAEMEGCDLSSWIGALDGAESVSPEVLAGFCRRFARWGLRAEALTPVYGLSEAALAVTFSDLGRPFVSRRFDRARLAGEGVAEPAAEGREIVSVGRAVPGFAVEVRDEGGRQLPPGRVGRVWTTGPSLMSGYLGRPEATARVLVDGWLDTGDRGFLDEHGELFLVGRAKDVLILRGRNHAPEEVEHVAGAVAGVRRGCVVAVSHLPEGAPGERLLLFVEHARGLPAAERHQLAAACREAVLGATGLAAEQVEVLPPGTLPRTSSGKLRRAETLARHEAGALTPPAPVTALRLAGALARSQLALARARRTGGGSAR